jgi:hypothetical protein
LQYDLYVLDQLLIWLGFDLMFKIKVGWSLWQCHTTIGYNGSRVGDVALCCACGKAILLTRCYRYVLLLCRVVVCQFCSVLVRWFGSSFAKLGFSVGLCGFANVPPNALAKFRCICLQLFFVNHLDQSLHPSSTFQNHHLHLHFLSKGLKLYVFLSA